jgi:predicted Fe-Mo cluster-binding NifX family protein
MNEESSKIRIGIPTGKNGGLEGEVNKVFARAETITLVMLEDGKITGVHVHENNYRGDTGRVGPRIADYLSEENVQVVLAYRVGGPLDSFLKRKGIEINEGYEGKVRDAIRQYLDSKGSMGLYER